MTGWSNSNVFQFSIVFWIECNFYSFSLAESYIFLTSLVCKTNPIASLAKVFSSLWCQTERHNLLEGLVIFHKYSNLALSMTNLGINSFWFHHLSTTKSLSELQHLFYSESLNRLLLDDWGQKWSSSIAWCRIFVFHLVEFMIASSKAHENLWSSHHKLSCR